MKTHPSYFEDTYRFEDQAIITGTGQDTTGHFILLNQTIFHPQGGGQPSDQGLIQVGNIQVPVYLVRSIENTIRHYVDKDYNLPVNQEVTCSLNQERRLFHARLHTAGHLISNIIETLIPDWKANKGHHFPNECYVEFASVDGQYEAPLTGQLTEQIENYITEDCLILMDQLPGHKVIELWPNHKYTFAPDQIIRVVRIGDFPFSPCGGTHVKSLGELKGLQITRIKIKGKTLKINYDMP